MEYTLEELLITGMIIHIFRKAEIRLFSLIGGVSTDFTPPITITNIEYIK